ncbi:hypothetical protein EJ04DRAFT_501849 [Polyplosphaeria fusca]|uniref:Uncharacterized protein n=1 Tax=Polyplosphaeria fusca TaxID=682080 RepID=A0A9P4QRF4_9PLEO|nr:hypothetical protein EJ04DRAFT_501849 [Polyplosphaeria fusca]
MPPSHAFPPVNSHFDPFNPEHTANLPDIDFSSIDWNDPWEGLRALGIGGPGTNIPIPKSISADQVKKEARHHSFQILKDFELLRAILDRHEPTIHKRWTKKTVKQKHAILLSTWPNMATTHRPDFQAFKKETEQERDAGTKYREAYLWPYINLDDLSKPKALPLLLQSRARNTPDIFAFADNEAVHLGFVTKAIVPAFLNVHTMMFTNRKTPNSYGELIAWKDNDNAFQWMLSRQGMHPGIGLVILEIQERLYRFLVESCERIMHDIPFEDLLSDKYAPQPPMALPPDTTNGFASLAVMAKEAPYRPPANMDLARLASLFAAKKSAAEDFIWELREDPGYFADTVLENREHRLEMIRDTDGQTHPCLTAGRKDVLWNRVIGNVVAGAHTSLEMWSELNAQVEELQTLWTKYSGNIRPDRDLPGEFLDAILKFQHYLKQAAKGPIGQLKNHAYASPLLRTHFVRIPRRGVDTPIIEVRSKPGVKRDKVQAELFWLLQTLTEDGNNLYFIGLTNIVDELERLIQSERTAKDMISSFIADVIADLSIFTEGLRQLKTFQPWAQTFENSLIEREEEIQKEFAETTKSWGMLMAAIDGPAKGKIVQLGQPEGRKFHHPVDKRRTRGNVEAMRSAEENLDKFWAAVDKNMRDRFGSKLKNTALFQLLSQSRILERTAEWIEPEQEKQSNVTVITKPLSEMYFDIEQRTERTLDRVSPSYTPTTKTKTRGKAAAEAPAANIQTPSPQLDIQPTFPLDARALKVFRALFYTPSLSATPGEIPWTDFLHAMVSTGFQVEKLYGSVWQFSPTNLDVERGIQFHEPHPSGKLRYVVARRFGRRLNKAYGWEGRMFVMEEE